MVSYKESKGLISKEGKRAEKKKEKSTQRIYVVGSWPLSDSG